MVGMTSHGTVIPSRRWDAPHAARNGIAVGLSDRRSESRAKILTAARKLFTEQGYEHTRPQDICREAGVGQGSFYLYFKDKLDCFLTFTQDADRELNEFVGIYSTGSMPFEAKIHAILCGAFDYAEVNPGVLRAVIADTKVLSMYGAVPFKIGTAEFLSVIEEGKQRGEVAQELNSKHLVYLTWGAISLGCAQAQAGQMERREIIENITAFLVRGTRPNQTIPNNNIRASKLPLPAHLKETLERSWKSPSHALSEKRLVNHRKLCAAARDLFAKKGYDAIGPKEISKKAGVAVGTFYSYFDDKLDCFLEVITQAACEMYDYIIENLSSASSCEEMMRLLIRAAFEYSAENPGVCRTILVGGELLAKSNVGVEFLPTHGAYCSNIAGLADAGYISPLYNRTLPALLIAGAIKQSDAYIAEFPSKREQIIEDTTRFVLNAICTSE